MTGALIHQLFDERLEDLDRIHPALAQRVGILRHAAVGRAVQPGRVETGAADVVLQAEPGRRHFRNPGEARVHEVGEAEVRPGLPPDHIERVARHRLRKGHHGPVAMLLLILHHAHRAAPDDIGAAAEEARRGIVRAVGPAEFHLQPPLAVSVQFQSQVEGSVEDRPERLEQPHHAL